MDHFAGVLDARSLSFEAELDALPLEADVESWKGRGRGFAWSTVEGIHCRDHPKSLEGSALSRGEEIMLIHCDHCGNEIERKAAVPFAADDGEVYYFCTESCKSNCRFLTPVELPDRDDRGVGSQVPVDDDPVA